MTRDETRRNRAYAPRMSPQERRAQLLDAVLKIINEQGIQKVSMDTVAREVGVTRPVVYSVFTDTDDLLRASLDREQAGALEQLDPIMPKPGAQDPAAAVLDFLAGFLAAVVAAPGRWRAAFTLVDSNTPVFRRRIEQQRKVFIGYLEDFLRASTAQPLDVEMTARALFAFIWDAGRLVLAEPEQFPPQRIRDFAQKAIPRQLNK